MSDTQYEVLQELFHEYNEAFRALPAEILEAYYDRLYSTHSTVKVMAEPRD